MKAIRFHRTGGPEVLVHEDVATPDPGPGHVRVRVHAAGVNFADTRFRRGEYFVRPQFPQIPGMEASGVVDALGDGTTGVAVGDRVMVVGANTYAEWMLAKPEDLFPMPAGLGFVEAAALPIQGLTAHHVLGLCGRMQPGESVLVHAAAGGVGSLAVQLAKRRGAKLVIATASSEAKLALARDLGADLAIDYTRTDWVAEVRNVTKGLGVDVLLEMLGSTDMLKRNLACLAPFGRMIVFGAATGDTRGTLEPVGLMGKNQTVTGYYLTPILKRRELCVPALAEMADLACATTGRLRIVVGQTWPLAEAEAAHRALEGRGTTGKVVLTVGGAS
ncbi:MAG: quinone oxidoreductase [Polyangiaceae bacterium]